MSSKARLQATVDAPGENEKMFGYLVYSEEDNVYVGIVDANTVKLSYYYAGSLGAGPWPQTGVYLIPDTQTYTLKL